MIDIYDSKALYAKIDALRKEKGWSINRLAQEAGISAMALYHWREREFSPTLLILDALCSAMGTNIINFLMDEDDISEHRELMEVWNRLSPEQQRNMLTFMKSML